MKAKFVIKNMSKDNLYAFIDLYSDFKAVVDEAGLEMLRNIFSSNDNEYNETEEEIIQTLLDEKLIESREELNNHILEERTGSLLGQIELELTKRCNLPCIHCFTDKIKQDIPLEIVQQNIEEFLKLGITDIVLNGGEIFLHKQIESILDLLSGKFKIILYSNGTIKNMLQIVQKYKIARVNISLDGFLEAHEYIRGKGTYNKTIHIIESLIQQGTPVQVDCVVYKKNNSNLEEFIEYCRNELKVCGVKLSTIYPLGEAKNHPELFEDAQVNEKIYEMYLKEKNPGGLNTNYLPCLAGITKAFINAYGQVYPCRLFEDNDYGMGDLRQTKMDELYSGFVEKESYFTTFKVKDHKSCSSCKSLKTCKTGCRARALLSHDSIYAADEFACNHNLQSPSI